MSTFSLACSPPTDAVMDWLRAQGDPNLSTDEVAVVHVGTGTAPGSDWWVVAAPSYDFHFGPTPGAVERTNMYAVTWLTDSTTWISLFNGQYVDENGVFSAAKNWDNISWTGDRLARGQAAQDMVIACVST
ncbi:MAG: hypothetical protein FWD63_01580 [Propionibacteriaceae bacterium]|nr:hypothetical protein [Propionibacteriaceae bacterium]